MSSDSVQQQSVTAESQASGISAARNLIEFSLFLLISIVAYSLRDINIFASASEPLKQILGYPPPAYLVSIALLAYCFSASILIFCAMAQDKNTKSKWNLFYRSAFYLFYAFSGAIEANFLPVLLIGTALYLLDQCHLRVYHLRQLPEKQSLRF